MAFEDADHVLKNLDDKNVKALNRRAVACKVLGRVEEAIRDFQALMKTNPTNSAEIKKDLDELMVKLIQQQKAKKEAEAAAPTQTKAKIQEIPESKSTLQKPKVQEQPEEEKSTPKTTGPKKTKNLDAEIINKAVEITSEKINKKLLNNVPKTAAGFESDFNSLKKDHVTFYAYMRNIPVELMPQLFKNHDMSAEIFSAILTVLN